MALGGSLLPLLLWLWPAGLAQDPLLDEPEDTSVTAPPEVTALIPAAVEATLAAGYLPGSTSGDAGHVAPVTAQGIPVPPAALGTPPGSLAPHPHKANILIVGDTRYQWQEWSPWHCNCPLGSMSRVRDITYSMPGLALDPTQYDVLRFQRVVCDYGVCHCEDGQCDRLQVTCDEEEKHICALRDIEQAQRRKAKDFWARLHADLKRLWEILKEEFPRGRKETKARSTR